MTAKILARKETTVSPWVRLVEKTVQFEEGAKSEVYHSVGVADYIAVVALTPKGLVPIVRQYRPAVEAYTWELPAGLVDPGESPESACRRELREETGVDVISLKFLGEFHPDTGRLTNTMHVFFARCTDPIEGAKTEEGVEVAFVEVESLRSMIRDGSFRHSLHLCALMAASVDTLTL